MCVGRNYLDHARELNNPVPDQPILFIKPQSSMSFMDGEIIIPANLGDCHHELELSILIGQPLTNANESQALSAIAGIGLGLDLTLRDLQNTLKEKRHPWERAKAFDGACPLSSFVSADDIDLQQLGLELVVNGQIRQLGSTENMLFPVLSLIKTISESFSLLPGDIVLTGTPAGVGALNDGDTLKASLTKHDGVVLVEVNTRVVSQRG